MRLRPPSPIMCAGPGDRAYSADLRFPPHLGQTVGCAAPGSSSLWTGRYGAQYFDDDGAPLDPDLAPMPSLCTVCRHRDGPKQEPMCDLNRLDQEGGGELQCGAFERAGDASPRKPPEVPLRFLSSLASP